MPLIAVAARVIGERGTGPGRNGENGENGGPDVIMFTRRAPSPAS
jgi:hypothetical protein